jgi:hypothetical protein
VFAKEFLKLHTIGSSDVPVHVFGAIRSGHVGWVRGVVHYAIHIDVMNLPLIAPEFARLFFLEPREIRI